LSGSTPLASSVVQRLSSRLQTYFSYSGPPEQDIPCRKVAAKTADVLSLLRP